MRRRHDDGIAKTDDPSFYHSGRDAAMAPCCLEAAAAETFLEPCARLAPAGGFQQGVAYLKTPALQAEQIDAGYGDVSSQRLQGDWFLQQ